MRRLLLCDDAADYRALVDSVLAGTDDFTVVGEAVHGRDCLDKVGDVDPDVVLLDLDMPLMDGFEALPRLREQAPSARIVVLTSSWSAERERRAMDLGATAFLEKPRNVLELPDALRAALGPCRARD
ncbi:MAG TPA: response regulator [Solirubrobacteraceae bacterium]|jgi:DNA-binding NarL/FixJ family response regulator|nr:response regulator [Solirubrobacteraceae bacterium]